MEAVSTDRLTKRFGHSYALDALDLHIEVGDVFGYLGPNGAGNLGTLAGAGLNLVPTALLVLGIGAVVLAVAPRSAPCTAW